MNHPHELIPILKREIEIEKIKADGIENLLKSGAFLTNGETFSFLTRHGLLHASHVMAAKIKELETQPE